MVSFQNEWVTRFLSLSTMQHFFTICDASDFGCCLQKMHTNGSSSWCNREQFLSPWVCALAFFFCYFLFFPQSFSWNTYLSWIDYWMALLIYKRQTINNRINTWTIPWWSAVVKNSNKENSDNPSKMYLWTSIFFFVFFYFWFITFNISAEMQCFVFGMSIFRLSDYSFNLCLGVYFDLKCHCVENTMLFFRMDRLYFGQ